jgi:predicted DNA-binding protein with PD1-like motif
MFSKEVKENRRFVFRLKKGEEVVSAIEKFAAEKNLAFCSVQLIGAVEDVELGYLKLKEPENEVVKNRFKGSHEFLAIGNISLKDGKHSAHIHAFVGTIDKKLFGGHLVSAKVSVTTEGVILEMNERIGRKIEPEIKYAVLDL